MRVRGCSAVNSRLRQAQAQGRGAASVDGKMIDAASERMARTVIAMDEAIRAAAVSRG
jgi:citrate lyase subunit beta/citryl-CoA lyase